jgi:formyl-CoA transferase
MLQDSQTPEGLPLTLMNAGFMADADGPGLQRRLPALGEHTDEVLADVGYTPEEIARLRATEVI